MDNLSLYKLTAEMQEILTNGFNSACVDEEGEIDEAKVNAYFNGLSVAVDTKIDNIACYIKSLRATVVAFKAEEEALSSRRKALEKKADKLTEYLSTCLQVANMPNFESTRNKLTFRRSTSVNIFNEDIIPEDFMNIKTVRTPDKKAIQMAIKDGEIIAGVELIEKQNIQIK